jgi:hypothetical protein
MVGHLSARVQESGFSGWVIFLGAFHWISHFLEFIANLSALVSVITTEVKM